MRIGTLLPWLLMACNLSVVLVTEAANSEPSPTLSTEASEALAGAQARVNRAKSLNALWTTAQAALEQAQESAQKGDSEAVLRFARRANEQAFLGMAQLGYPLVESK